MSDDPETRRQIAELARDTRPLLVLDVDEVILEFIRPFMAYLEDNGLRLDLSTFRLHGNVSRIATGETVDAGTVSAMIDSFFADQDRWQVALAGAAEGVARLARSAEIVMLTSMPHRHRDRRRSHLDRLGFPYPLVTTEAAKGPAIRALRGDHARPVAFIDDIPANLASVRSSVADSHLFHLMATSSYRHLLPPVPDGVVMLDDWPSGGERIATALAL